MPAFASSSGVLTGKIGYYILEGRGIWLNHFFAGQTYPWGSTGLQVQFQRLFILASGVS